MNYKYILALDPSGNFTEGKGITGICLFSAEDNKIIEVTNLAAKNYTNEYEYWGAHLTLIDQYVAKYRGAITLVVEDYVLYANKANDQINSRMETPKVIGIIQHHCYNCSIPITMQLASAVKNRWSDNVLAHKKYIERCGTSHKLYNTTVKVSRHVKDAIRHAVHYATFYNKEDNYEHTSGTL